MMRLFQFIAGINFSLDDLLLLYLYGFFFGTIQGSITHLYINSSGLLVFDHTEALYNFSRPFKVVLLRLWFNMEIIHVYLDAIVSEWSEGVSQEGLF